MICGIEEKLVNKTKLNKNIYFVVHICHKIISAKLINIL